MFFYLDYSTKLIVQTLDHSDLCSIKILKCTLLYVKSYEND